MVWRGGTATVGVVASLLGSLAVFAGASEVQPLATAPPSRGNEPALWGRVLASQTSVVVDPPTSTSSPPSPTNTPVLPTPTATPTPAEVLGPHWLRIETADAPRGLASAGFCLDEQRCWFVENRLTWVGGLGERYIGTVHRTQDGGVTWSKSQDLNLSRQLVFLDGSVGFTEDARSEDGGLRWAPVLVEATPLSGVVFTPDRRTGYGCDPVSRAYRTTDAGASWVPWAGECPGSKPGIQFLDTTIAWALGDPRSGRVAYTVDGWQTSRPLQVGTEGESLGTLHFVDYEHGWIGGRTWGFRALIYRTEDAGQRWERRELPVRYQEVQQLRFVTHSKGWAVATVAGPGVRGVALLRTDDGGHSWSEEVLIHNHTAGNSLTSWLLYSFNERLGWAAVGQSGIAGSFEYGFYKRYPDIALTPTATPTPTKTPIPVTPTPTWTPYPLPIPGYPTPATTPSSRTPTPEPPGAPSGREALVSQVYRGVLCREPDPDGLAAWVHSTLNEPDLRDLFRTSPEGQRVAAVRAAYLTTLGRDPVTADCAGLRGWVDGDLALPEIAAALAGSPEGQRVRGVRDLYLELLGRDPLGSDNEGLRYWVEWLVPLAQVRAAIMESEEYRRRQLLG